MTSLGNAMTLDDFMALIHDELGLRLTVQDATVSFDELPGWDSVLALQLLAALERVVGRRISMPDALEARNLRHIYELAVAQ
jgi:acyl carrier protein